MRRFVASTAVIGTGGVVLPPSRIERDEEGRVVAVVPLAQFAREPEATTYYSGVITADVWGGIEGGVSGRVGTDIRGCVVCGVDVGYEGRLLLWRGVSLSDFVVRGDTVVTVL